MQHDRCLFCVDLQAAKLLIGQSERLVADVVHDPGGCAFQQENIYRITAHDPPRLLHDLPQYLVDFQTRRQRHADFAQRVGHFTLIIGALALSPQRRFDLLAFDSRADAGRDGAQSADLVLAPVTIFTPVTKAGETPKFVPHENGHDHQ